MADVNLYGEIGGVSEDSISAAGFAEMTAAIDSDEPLTIYLNSGGGSVFDGLTIYQSLVAREGPNHIVVQGVAASIASVIAMAGDTIAMSQSSRFMIHNPMGPSALAFGTADDLREAADDTLKTAELLDSVAGTLVDIYASRTGSSRSQLREWMEDEKWLTAAEAKKFGFADTVRANKKLAANTFARPVCFAMERDELDQVAKLARSVQMRLQRSADPASRESLELSKARLFLTEQS